jgi:hypothetical protein
MHFAKLSSSSATRFMFVPLLGHALHVRTTGAAAVASS